MTDRPILFSGPMIRALLDGRKTQTRRVLKPQPYPDAGVTGFQRVFSEPPYFEAFGKHGPISCAFAKGAHSCEPFPPIKIAIGDRLWVRETCRAVEHEDGTDAVEYIADGGCRTIRNTAEAADKWGELYYYGKTRPDHEFRQGAKVPSIHMPRWASRITLTVTDVRVQRLQDISEADAVAEGCFGQSARDAAYRPGEGTVSAVEDFADLWNSINGPDAWSANPWVAAYTFTVEKRNIEQ